MECFNENRGRRDRTDTQERTEEKSGVHLSSETQDMGE